MYGDDLLEVDRDARPGTPRYCLRCDLDAEPGEKICHQCGEILREQAFCPVCEAYWHLLAGTDCPKHEIPLQDRAPDPYPYLPRDEQLEWTTVARFVNVTEAEARRLRLEAEGIPVFVEGERNQNYYGCEAKLQVPRKHVADARILLSQTWTSALEQDDLEDAWEELAPSGWENLRRMAKGFDWLCLAVALTPLGLWLIAALVKILNH